MVKIGFAFTFVMMLFVSTAQAQFGRPTVEVGTSYVHTTEDINYSFSNDQPRYGDPTSTIDWKRMPTQSGEVYARVTFRSLGLFFQGTAGQSKVTGGSMVDKDFYAGQAKWSDVTSLKINGAGSNVSLDLGLEHEWRGFTLGAFGGYHRLQNHVTAYGMHNNMTKKDMGDADTSIMVYEPVWNALRLGLQGQVTLPLRFSISGEMVWTPIGLVTNEDSHLLRTSMNDLGPTPNIHAAGLIDHGRVAGLRLNYAITRSTSVGVGVRYLGEFSQDGNVSLGGIYEGQTYPLRAFDGRKSGLVVSVSRKF